MIYLQLFLSFLQVGMFSFGGGYAAMPLIQGQIVTGHHWLSMSEFTDLITISQMTPGPIAVNSATFVGIKIAGIPGALAATFGCILPSCIIVTVIAKLYLKYRSMEVLQGVFKTCSCGDDRISRNLNPDHGILGKQGSDRSYRDEVESDTDFCSLHDITSKSENESNMGDDSGRSDESWNITHLKVDEREKYAGKNKKCGKSKRGTKNGGKND